MKLPQHINHFALVASCISLVVGTTEAVTIRNKLMKNINGTVQTIYDAIMNVTIPIESSTPPRRVWISYERGKHTSVLSGMETSRAFTTSMVPIYDFPAMNAIVTIATDAEIAALLANSTLGPMNVTDDPVRYPMIHSTRKLKGSRSLQSNQETPYGIPLTQVDQLWAATGLTGAGITVCVIDSGLDTSNPDFDTSTYTGDSLVTGSAWNTDSSGHGTHVTGTISASNNSFGVVGVAPGVTIHTVDVFSDFGFAYASALVDAAYKCRDAGAKVISMSLGGPQYSEQENTIFTQLYNFNGILSVAAAGNDGTSDYSFPASYDNVLSVGAADQSKNLAFFSNFNDRVDLVAPGVDILSTLPTGASYCEICSETGQFNYGEVSGTSQATPHVSGIAALLWSHDPTLSVEMIYNALIDSAEDLGLSGRFVSALDAYNALTSMSFTLPPNRPPTPAPVTQPISVPVAITSPPFSDPIEPTPPPSSDASAPAPPPVSSSCVVASLALRTDAYPTESYVKLIDAFSGSVLWFDSPSEPYQDYTITAECLDPNGCYLFEMYDTFGDGLCCNNGYGYFELSYNFVRIFTGNEFGSYAYYYFGDGCSV